LNSGRLIENEIEHFLDLGYNDKKEIYNKVVEKLGVPRPTVRRVARDLRLRMINRVKILQNEIDKRGWTNNENNT